MQISRRLQAIAEMVTPGSRLADVGTDHGYVPIYLMQSKRIVFAVASDVRPGPLARAKQNIEEAGLSDYIEVRLSDGLAALKKGEADTILIAGMGGPLMERILQERLETACAAAELILQPQSEIPAFRRFLAKAGLCVTQEKMICEGGKYYLIMKAVPGRSYSLTASQERFGTILPAERCPVFLEYLAHEYQQQLQLLGRLSGLENERMIKRKHQVRQELAYLECARKGIEYMEQETITVVVDNQKRRYPKGTLYKKIVEDVQPQYENDILLVLQDRKIRELFEPCEMDCELVMCTAAERIGQKAYERSMILMMLKSVYDVAPKDSVEQVRVEFSLQEGIYCTIRGSQEPNASFLEAVERRMRKVCEADLPIVKIVKNTEDAIEDFKRHGMYDKVKLFEFRNVSKVNLYNLDGFEDYYYGSMVYSTGYLKYFRLHSYEDGFVLQLPETKNPKQVADFHPYKKLFEVQIRSTKWAQMLGIDTVGELNWRITKDDINELILVQEALQEKEIAEIADRIYMQPDIKIVLIAGPSSSGKTTFSHRLSVQLKTLGLKPHPIPVDNYFVNREETPVDENGIRNWEDIGAIDIERLNSDMLDLLSGKCVQLPTYNFITGKREFHKENRLQIGGEDILVLEGIHCLNEALTSRLEKKNKFKIYISALTTMNVDEHNRIATTDGRLIRRMVRDARTRGSSALDTIARWPSVRRGEENNIFPYQEEADVMFNSSLFYELSVLKQYAEPVLYSVDRNSPEIVEAERLLKFLGYFVGISGENVPANSLLREFIGGGCFQL